MLIQLEENNARILLNGAFYGINAVIAANTLFQEIFSTEVSDLIPSSLVTIPFGV